MFLLFFESLWVKPHATCHVHMVKKSELIPIRDVFLISVVFTHLAESMGKVTLPFAATEIQTHAYATFQSALIRKGFGEGSPFLQMEKANFEGFVQKLHLCFFSWLLPPV